MFQAGLGSFYGEKRVHHRTIKSSSQWRNHRGFCGAVRCGLYHLPQRLKGRLSRQLVAGALHNELFPVLHGPYSGEANGDNIAFRKHQNFIWLPVLHRAGDPAPLLPPAPPCGRILAEKGGDTMIPLNTEAAIKQSLEIAKILCQSPNVHISPNAEGANGIADFIETLQERFTRNPDTDQK